MRTSNYQTREAARIGNTDSAEKSSEAALKLAREIRRENIRRTAAAS